KITIEIIGLPEAPETKNLSYCQGAQNIQPLTAKGAGNAIFSWYDASGNLLSAAPTPSTSQAGPQVYFVSQKASPDGCESEKAKITIEIIALPSAPIVKNLSYCQNEKNVQPLDAESAHGSMLAWYDASGNRLDAAPTPSTAIAGTIIYYVSARSAAGCEGIKTQVRVNINPLPEPPVVKDIKYCQNEIAEALTATGENLKWYDEYGNSLPQPPTPSTSSTGIINYFVTQTVSSGCESASSRIVITILAKPEKPIISASGPAEICEGSSVMLSASLATSYQWFNNGNALAGENRQTLRVNKGGKYSVQTMNLSACSSESSDFISINVISISSKPSITAQGKFEICEGEAVLLKSSSVADNQWYKDGEAIAGATGQTYLAKVAGQYSVITKSKASCEIPVSDPVRVTVNPILPAPVINSEANLVICKGGRVTLTSSTSEITQWFKDGVLIPGANSSTLIASSSGKYTVRNRNASGCEGPSSNAVNVVEQAFAITLDANTKSITYGSKVLVNVSSNLKYKILSWSPSNIFENASATAQTVTMQKDLKIVVNAISENGCLASATLDLRADTKKDLFIPNTFTPNGDGKNDVFKVFGTGIEMVELLIYSQWGELIYKSKQQDPIWDGTFRGVMQPVGVYVYKCVIRFKDGEEMTKNGAINLLR
ncbi:MAG: T9SS type B sorting domain-containing protein, partial [Pedobacter sp.]